MSASGEEGSGRERESEGGDGVRESGEDSFDFTQALREANARRCKLNKLHIVGNVKTKAKIIEREFNKVKGADSLLFDQFTGEVLSATEELRNLNIFETIDVVLESPEDHAPGLADVILTVEEKSNYGLQTGAWVEGSSEVTGEVSGTVKNLLGYAEEFELFFSLGSLKTGKYSLSWKDGRFLGTKSLLQTQLFRTSQSFQQSSSFTENRTGFATDWASADAVHKLGYELAFREIFCANSSSSKSGGSSQNQEVAKPSKEVLQQAGHNMKSSLKHTMVLDNRKAVGMLSQGLGFQAMTEVCGIGLDPNLFRCVREEVEVVVETPLSLFKDWQTSLELRFKGGVLMPWGKGCFDKPTYIGDRFFLGGTSSLRGFHIKGAGPTGERRIVPSSAVGDQESMTAAAAAGGGGSQTQANSSSSEETRDALGGDIMYSALAAVNFEVPFLPALKEAGIYGHLYGNAGNCVGLAGYDRQGIHSTLKELKEKTRVSMGVGLVWPSPIGKIEVNYCRVKRSFEHDKWRNGFHFGFATSNLDMMSGR